MTAAALGDYVELQRGNTYKSALLERPGPVLLGLASIARNGGFRRDSLRTYGGESDERMLLRPGDLYVSLKDVTQSADLLGAIARVPSDIGLGRLTQDTVKLKFRAGSESARKYVYWVLRGPDYREYCRSRAMGTTNLSLSREDFLGFPIRPPSPTDLAGVELLDALDDRIDLNRRTNSTLEAMAQALFKSWFVDFDPVRAKAEGRHPWGMDEETAALFPPDFGSHGDEGLPRGWSAVPLPHAIEVNPSRRLPKGAPAPYLDMANVPVHSPRALDVIERPFGSGTRFVNGDTLLARITPCLENGKTAFVDFLQDEQVGWGSTEYIVLHPKPPLSAEHAYFLARTPDFRAFAIGNMTGTTGRQRVPADCLSRYDVTVPSPPVAERFGHIARSALRTMKSHDDQSRTLATLRDSLLPKLLSGELRVKDAEAAVAASV